MLESLDKDILQKEVDIIKAEHNSFLAKHGYPTQNFLYKYSSWAGNKHIRENIKNSKLFFSNSKNFNDPFDTYPIFTMPRVKNASDIIKKIIPEMSKEFYNKLESIDINIEQFVNSFYLNKHNGVCCFTIKNDNLLMWAHYADYHKGVCLEFENNMNLKANNNQNILITLPKAVIYSNKRPKVDLMKLIENSDSEAMVKELYTKSKEWKYENEYRCISLNYTGEVAYNPSGLKAIILGCKMDDITKNEVREFARELEYSPKIYEAKLKKHEYGIEIIEAMNK